MNQDSNKVIKDYMPWAIVVTIFCNLPFGIVSIVKCAKVSNLLDMGRYTEAIHASWKAKQWVWLTFYIGILLGFVLSFIVPYVSYFEYIDGIIDVLLTAIGVNISFAWVKVPFVGLLVVLGIFCLVKIGESLYTITEGECFLFADWWKTTCEIIFWTPVCTWWIGQWVESLYDSSAFPFVFMLWLIFGIFCWIGDETVSWADIGDKFHYGKGVPQCYELAVHYYEKDSSSSWVQSQLGWHYEYGKGVEANMRKAAEYYQLSADAGRVWSQNQLGICYEEGKGVRQSYDIAAHYYMKAAKKGDMYAQWNIGRMYRNGTGVPKSLVEAIDWYHKAANQGHKNAKMALEEIESVIQGNN